MLARSTSFSYKGRSPEAKEVARELGVNYVLEGSVRREGEQVRINAQLIDGLTGGQLWAEKFDRKLKNVIALQNEITSQIAAVLRAELLEAESRRPKPNNLKAWDNALKGQVILQNSSNRPRAHLDAQTLFNEALALDPTLALAWEGIAYIQFVAATRVIPGVTVPNSSDLGLAAARKAVALDSRSSNAFRVLGLNFYWRGKGADALAACQRALELNPNNDQAVVCLSRANYVLGNLEKAIYLIDTAVKLNPKFRPWLRYFYVGNSQYFLGDFKAAVNNLTKATAMNPKHQSVKFYLAAALAMNGQEKEARSVLSDYLKMENGTRDTIEKIRIDRSRITPKFERLAEGLRRAGMPEH